MRLRYIKSIFPNNETRGGGRNKGKKRDVVDRGAL